MFRFPYNGRQMPRPPQYQRPVRQEKKVSYEDLMKNASFSPELSFLLAMLLKDGMNQSKVYGMLNDIEPFVSGGDRSAIHSIVGAMQMTDEFRKSTPEFTPPHANQGLAEFSKLSRQNALLSVLMKYASGDTGNIMRNLQRSYEMQENYERMIKRLQKLRNMQNASTEDMFEAISMFMPPSDQANIRNMQNMMRMMGSMNNFKPEDIFKFMGMGNKS